MTTRNNHPGNHQAAVPTPPGDSQHLGQAELSAATTTGRGRGLHPRIRIRLLCADIGDVAKSDASSAAGDIPIDAFAVGHYSRVDPVNAERALDEAISHGANDSRSFGEADLILAGLTARGIITGSAAKPFFLPDPYHPGRIIAVAGMGEPGRFSVRELPLLVRELCWSLGWLGKKHLATVLIGAGDGNVPPSVAVEAWLWGAHAAWEEATSTNRCLEAITLVEVDPGHLRDINRTLAEQGRRKAVQRFADMILLTPEDIGRCARVFAARPRRPRKEVTQYLRAEVVSTAEGSTRKYRLSALTAGAAVADMQSDADPQEVAEKGERLMMAAELEDQFKIGRELEGLLIPEGMRSHLTTDAPLTVECDAATAQIPWEMLALPGAQGLRPGPATFATSFWGLYGGLTRRIRVSKVEDRWPRWRPGRLLRVLVIADPSETHPLEEARTEGPALKRLFDEFNSSEMAKQAGNHISCELRLGPQHGTRPEIFRSLNQKAFDVLHFAGHCDYHSLHTELSGWELARGETLNAEQLESVNQVPGVVFANACSSGRLPDRGRTDLAALAPTLAEAFFSRGVRDFVCTAWTVNDESALTFAREFYRQLLGLERTPQPLHVAMRAARRKVMEHAPGRCCWGAYQHYGNPHARLFAPER